MILVDTDILIDLIRGESGAGQFLDKIALDESLAVSIVSRAWREELVSVYDVERGKEPWNLRSAP